MRLATVFSCLLLCMPSAWAISAEERREFLNDIRPEATRQAGQPVRFKVDRLNMDGGWAVLVGELRPEAGQTLDWRKAPDCDPNLDKGLWVVAQHTAKGWQVREMHVCSPEPSYWYLDPNTAFARPCGIYAGLTSDGAQSIETQCQQHQTKGRRRR